MARKSISTKKSLKSLFSKSEADLKQSVEDDSGKSSARKFFKLMKKKKSATDGSEDNLYRTETATSVVRESQDGEKQSIHRSSLFDTGPRSKKGLLSYSETDLRKPRSFSAFTLNWKRKKRDLSKSGVKGYFSEQDEFKDHVEAEEAYTISNQPQTQDALSYMALSSRGNELEDAAIYTEAFMPSGLDSDLIPYIDSSFSDSDGYQTPPESPATGYFSSVAGEYQTPDEVNISEAASIFSRHQMRFSQMNCPEPVTVTDALHRAEDLSRYYDAVDDCLDTNHASPDAVDGSSQYYNYISPHLKLNGVSGRDKTFTMDTVVSHPIPMSSTSFNSASHLPNYSFTHPEHSQSNPNSDYPLAKGDSSPIYDDVCDLPNFSTANLHHLKESRPDFNSETVSMESPQTDNNTTCAVDSEEPCPAVAGPVYHNIEPVPPEDESKTFLAQSGTHTSNSTKTDTFDLSGPITFDPDRSWRVLSDNTSYSYTASQSEKQDDISNEMGRAKSASYENLAREHSRDLFDSLTRKEKIYHRTIKAYEGINVKDTLYKESFKSYETVDQDGFRTTENNLQMFETKSKPEDEDYRQGDIHYKNNEVTPIDVRQNNSEQTQSVKCIYVRQNSLDNIVEKYNGVEKMTSTSQVKTIEAEVCEDTEVLTGQAERKIHCFAPLKPALPVNQDCVSKECNPAPPSSQPVKVSLADSSIAAHNHLETWLRPFAPQRSSGEKTLPEETARTEYQTSTEIHHAERAKHIKPEDTRAQSTEGQDKISATRITEDSFTHTKNPSYNQGEISFTELKTAANNITTFNHRSVVDISETTPEGRRQVEDLHTAEVNILPTRLIPGDRFFHVPTVLSTVIEESDTENEAGSEPGSDTEMSSGIAILNTKLNRPSSSREGREDIMVVRKVSLVNSDSKNGLRNHESALDSNGLKDYSEQSTASPELRRRWQGLYSDTDVIHSKSFVENSDYNLTRNSYMNSTQQSSGYEKGVYTSHFSPGAQKSQSTSFSLESNGSLGNSSWKVIETEVQQGSENYFSGRSGVELTTPVGAREGESERGIRKTGFDSQVRLENSLMITEDGDESLSDVFRATRVELDPSPTDLEPKSHVSSSNSEMDSLVDTLKSMDRPLRQRVHRTASNTPFSSLPPIEEDAPILPSPQVSAVTEPKKALNGVSSLPLDLGFKWSSKEKDMRSPLALLKEQQSGENARHSLPMRASALSSIVMRRGSLNDLSSEETPATGLVNGGGLHGSSRLENSLFFQLPESGHRSIFRAASLPDIGSGHERISSVPKRTDSLLGNRFSYLMSSSSLSGLSEPSRISMPPSIPSNSSTENLGYEHKSSLELFRTLPSETLLKNSSSLGLQRSSSVDGALYHLPNDIKGFKMKQKPKPEPERSIAPKYRAFPDSYITKEKEHGKLNPRPGKMFIYDMPGMTGHRIEIRGDVVDATPWEFTGTISIRVIRGGWVFYERPDFKGEKIALDEGDMELTNPFGPPDKEDELKNGTAQDQRDEDYESKPQLKKKKFVIGSIRRAVRDYSVPEICFFPEENAEGKKVTFRDTSEDARIYGFPIKANSVIVNAGLWLVFADPFFQGVPRVLEVGGYPTPASWGVTHPYVSSIHPLKIGEPKVENLFDPKIVIYEKPYFTGKSREIYSSMRDFMTRMDNKQSLFIYSPGSMKVIGGCWVGYEKEGFRGHQYLLEEGEYHDWRVWGGVNSELRSARVIQTDLSEPMVMLYGEPEGEEETEEEHTFEVTEAVPDVELFRFNINTRSIHVLSGAWVAYSHVDFSGNQYVLEKGFYRGCGDWGSGDNRICSIQPILPAPSEGSGFKNEVLLYSEPGFRGTCTVCDQNMGRLPENLEIKSCRIVGGSWVLYEGDMFTGDQYVLSEGNYPNISSMGCPPSCHIRSVKSVPMTFSVPSISLFGLECFEGREVTVDTPIAGLQEEGFNTQFLSVRVNSGCWVLCEHSNYRGRQFLLEPIEITNWHKFSSLSSTGSLYPVRQKQRLFRIRNKESGQYMSVQGGVEDMKTGRVVVSEEVEGMSDVWFYQDGFIKNKLARTMSLQVMGKVEMGAKVVLWSETRTPVQIWSAQVSGKISSVSFPGMVLDVKGGKSYDKHHLIIREENDEHDSQQWDLEFV